MRKSVDRAAIFHLKFAVIAVLLCGVALPRSVAQTTIDDTEPRSGEYRVTVFPFHRINDHLTGFGYLGYVTNPDEDYTTEYLGYGFSYTRGPVVQWWAGLVGTFTQNEHSADKNEARPFVGVKLFLPNDWHWNIYNYTRWEYRAIQNQATDEWTEFSRFRTRFGFEAPLTSGDRAWKAKTWYALSDVEAMYRTDRDEIDPVRLRVGIAYIFSKRVRAELIYHMQWTQETSGGGLKFSENIWRLNIKIAMTHGIPELVMRGGDSMD